MLVKKLFEKYGDIEMVQRMLEKQGDPTFIKSMDKWLFTGNTLNMILVCIFT